MSCNPLVMWSSLKNFISRRPVVSATAVVVSGVSALLLRKYLVRRARVGKSGLSTEQSGFMVILRFEDGAECILVNPSPEIFRITEKGVEEGSTEATLAAYSHLQQGKDSFPYNVGDLVGIDEPSLLQEHAHYTFGEQSPLHTQGTVTDVRLRAAPPQPGLDRPFVGRMGRLLRILFPRLFSKETGVVVSLGGLLVTRSFLTIRIANIMGSTAKALVAADWHGFLSCLRNLLVIAVPASAINGAIRGVSRYLALVFRKNLVRRIHADYLKDLTFYRAANLRNQKISQVDQRITDDVTQFADSLSQLFTSSFKPLVDAILFSHKLAKSGGIHAPLAMMAYFVATSSFLHTVTPPFGELAERTQNEEGEFRRAHTRLISKSEPIAFYNGGPRELELLSDVFEGLANHLSSVFTKEGWYGTLEEYAYMSGAKIVGFCITTLPVFGSKAQLRGSHAILESFVTDFQMVETLGDSLQRLALLKRPLMNISGYSARVCSLLDMLNVPKGKNIAAIIDGQSRHVKRRKPSPGVPVPGEYLSGRKIKFEHVDIITPDRILLAPDVSFEILPGVNTLLTGPNGAGKSSLFRILGELWPLACGRITKPEGVHEIFYIPQKPYLCQGTLRDQIIYPHSLQEFLENPDHSDEMLDRLAEEVFLPGLADGFPKRWDTLSDWESCLSAGEKQRIAMARLYYHRPTFAILDECTSETALDVEAALYEGCAARNITIISICHRQELFKFHQLNIHFDKDHCRVLVREI